VARTAFFCRRCNFKQTDIWCKFPGGTGISHCRPKEGFVEGQLNRSLLKALVSKRTLIWTDGQSAAPSRCRVHAAFEGPC
jgi:hypothetical protein